MKTYFSIFVVTLIIGILILILGITYRKKLPACGVVSMILGGILIILISAIMCLCFGFFMG